MTPQDPSRQKFIFNTKIYFLLTTKRGRARRNGIKFEGNIPMRLASFRQSGRSGLAVSNGRGPEFYGCYADESDYPGDLASLIAGGADRLEAAGRTLRAGAEIDMSSVILLPPLPLPGKIICVGLNYADHSAESGFKVPDYPTIFGRFASSLIGHGAPIVRPRVSEQLDYEGEFVAVIGIGGRDIPLASALSHVAGYSLFNDASIRDYQFKAPQWTIGKNFDDTGAFGPYFVTADELPPGAKGLRLQTRLNGAVVQNASTDDLIFDVATLITTLSEAFTLQPGDIIVTGTPGGVGLARKPPLWMKPGDLCEVEMEGLGILSNHVIDQDEGSVRRVA
jgi:2-keto-4-pentenoate hydratase/2-oxohepta-3-ene-1,7-dioic acid hydratase in catechol pathway